jgi:hypothetical protein
MLKVNENEELRVRMKLGLGKGRLCAVRNILCGTRIPRPNFASTSSFFGFRPSLTKYPGICSNQHFFVRVRRSGRSTNQLLLAMSSKKSFKNTNLNSQLGSRPTESRKSFGRF